MNKPLTYGAVWTNAFYIVAAAGIALQVPFSIWVVVIGVALCFLGIASGLFHTTEFESNRPKLYGYLDETGMYMVLTALMFAQADGILHSTLPFVIACLVVWAILAASPKSIDSHVAVLIMVAINAVGIGLLYNATETVVLAGLLVVATLIRYLGEKYRPIHPYAHGAWHGMTAYILFRAGIIVLQNRAL